MKKYLTKDNLILALLLFIAIRWFFSAPTGISESEMTYRLEVQKLNDEKLRLLNENTKLEFKLNYFKDEIIKNNAAIDSFTISQIDSSFAAYFNR